MMIDGLYHFDGYGEMIKHHFKKIMNKANLAFINRSKNEFDDYLLQNNKCQIRFRYDRGDISCMIINLQNLQPYHVARIYKVLYPKEGTFSYKQRASAEDQLEKYAQMIEEKLMDVLNGDFTWELKIVD
jgi:hypothetical protein